VGAGNTDAAAGASVVAGAGAGAVDVSGAVGAAGAGAAGAGAAGAGAAGACEITNAAKAMCNMAGTIAPIGSEDKGRTTVHQCKPHMMRRVRTFPASPVLAVLAALPLFLHTPEASAAPHPRDVGDGVARLRSTTFLAMWGYDENAVRVDDDDFTYQSVALMVEAGIAPRLTLHTTLPFVFIPNSATPTPSTGDAVVGGLLAILDDDIGGDPLSLALTLDLKLPLYGDIAGGQSTPTTRGFAQNGKPVAKLPLDGAIDLYLGYRMRTGGITDAVVGGGRIGMWFLDKRFFVSATLDSVVTMLPDVDPRSGAVVGDDVIGRGFASVGGRASVRVVDRVFIDVGAAYVGRGTNAPGGVDLMFGASAGF
jgi:hypothetical protein